MMANHGKFVSRQGYVVTKYQPQQHDDVCERIPDKCIPIPDSPVYCVRQGCKDKKILAHKNNGTGKYEFSGHCCYWCKVYGRNARVYKNRGYFLSGTGKQIYAKPTLHCNFGGSDDLCTTVKRGNALTPM